VQGTASIQQAWRFFHANQLQQAEAICGQMLASDPRNADALILSGRIANSQGRWESAAALFGRALQIRGTGVEAHVGMGVANFGLRRFSEADSALTEALRLNPTDFDANQNMAILQRQLGNLNSSADHFRRAVEVEPTRPLVRVYLAMVLREVGRLEESDHELAVVLRMAPGLAEGHMQMAWNHHLQGRFEQGWVEYEWRWRCAGAALPRFPQPIWDGSDPGGKRIMLHAEQGYGDTIQFIRYARLLAERGARVVLYCQETIRELMSTATGLEQAVADVRKLPAFDMWCPLLSLPKRFGTTFETIPADVPYLRAEERRVSEWGQRVRDDPPGMRVGLCWAGSRSNPNHVRRSISPDELSPLGQVGGIVLYSLQVDAAGPVTSVPFIDHTSAIRDFADAAALMAHLDLVISVDTSAAHLAGALGKEVWTLIPSVPEWRWLMNRSDCPWYPTMRLIRKGPESWRELVQKVADELRSGNPSC
jgi:tetratricopeptide (TPR) repeat protein